ncbi:RND family transporter [Vibrio gigantis]|uniref:efflux RND transporter permease subunit n=1 Tax=Vibrio gigantis TaxID=296199 RepID=UPI0035A5D1A5
MVTYVCVIYYEIKTMSWFTPIKNGSLFVKYKWTTLLFTLLFTLGISSGAQHLYFDSSYKTFFAEDNPQRLEFEETQRNFTKSDNVLFVLTSPDSNVYQPEFLKAVASLTEKAWSLPFAVRVDSITNFQHVSADEDDLLVEDLVDTGSELSPEQLVKIREIALADPLLKNRLVKEGSGSTGIFVTLRLPEESPYESSEVGDAALALKEQFQQNHPNIDIRITGSTMLSHAFSASAQADGETIVPLMYAIVLVITFITLRSLLSTFISLIIIGMATSATLGISGWLGFYFTSISSIVPTIVLTLAVADSVHLLKTMQTLMRNGMSRNDAIVESMVLNHKAIFLTSMTTIIGFLGLNFSAVPNYHDLGNMTAIGVFFAYLFSITTLPALVAILPIKQKALRDPVIPVNSQRMTHVVTKYASVILVITSVLTASSIFMLPKMESYDEALKYFSQKIEFRRDSDFTIENLTGIETIEIALPSTKGSVAEPEYLADLEALKSMLEKEHDVIHVSTLSDTMKKLNRSMNGDKDEFYRLPEERELASQYLLLYELSLPRGLDLNNTVNLSKTSSKVVVTFGNTNSKRIIEVVNRTRQWIENNSRSFTQPAIGSPSVMFAHISKSNIESMLKGTALTFMMITLSIMIALRSLKLGALSILSNLIPAILAFGIWALLIKKADIAVAVAATVTIGIMVDFIVHFLVKYNKYRQNHNTETAIEKTIAMVSGPVLSTALILICGFSILALSEFRLNWVLGALSALIIFLATLFVFIVIPAILAKFDQNQPKTVKATQAL